MINTTVVYGIAQIGSDGVASLGGELYVDKMLAEVARALHADTESINGATKVWEFTLVRNCVKSPKDAEEFFTQSNGAASEILLL